MEQAADSPPGVVPAPPDAAAEHALRFVARHHADRLRIVNPHGDVGLVALWSPLRTVERKLEAISPVLLEPETSRIAAIGNLYGDGFHAMLCNLLHNPQVRHLVAFGQDLGQPTCDELAAFLRDGVEDASLLGQHLLRVRGTTRLLPDVPGFDADRLRARLTFRALGPLSRPGAGARLLSHLDALPRQPAPAEAERVTVALPAAGDEAEEAFRPSDVAAHQVRRPTPLACWEELVVRCVRFGRPVQLGSGPRRHLLNVKAIVEEPAEDPEPALERLGFSLAQLRAYGASMLDPALPETVSYTYGHRLRGWFDQAGRGTDTLQTVIDALRAEPETRHAYISLWDTARDLPDLDTPAPCLTTLHFRRSEDRLVLAATYRVHNLLDAWLRNVYGLMAVQRHVAGALGLTAGPITVVSHFLSLDSRSSGYALAQALERQWSTDDDVDAVTGKRSLRQDPNGYFVVSADPDRGCLIAEHRYAGVLVKRYEGRRAVEVEQQVAADMAVSLVSHALWLGRELTRHEQLLRARRG